MKFKVWFEKAFVKTMRSFKKTVSLGAAGVLIEKDGKYLLVQEGSEVIPEMQGKWNFPMGRIEGGEKPYRRALIEGRNETGLLIGIEARIKSKGTIRPYRQKDGYSVRIGALEMFIYLFEGRVISGGITVPPHLQDVKWFSFEEIEKMKQEGKLIDPYIMAAIADYKELIFNRMVSQVLREEKKL